MVNNTAHVVWFEALRRTDVPRVGGKNASLGEMVATLACQGVNVPPGFALTAEAFWRFSMQHSCARIGFVRAQPVHIYFASDFGAAHVFTPRML